MKHAIIPTDFTTQSLKPVHDVVRYFKDEPVRITLLHLINIPEAIGDLLFRLRRTESRFPIPDVFRQACEMMMNKYEHQVTSLMPLIQYGSTAAYLENLVDGLKADAIFMQQDYELSLPFEDSVKMLPIVRRSDCKIITTNNFRTGKSVGAGAMSNLLVANS